MGNKEIVKLKMSIFRDIEKREEYCIDEVATSNEAIACYTALRIIYDKEKKYHYENSNSQETKLSTEDLLQALGYDVETKRLQRQKESIKKGLAILDKYDVVNSSKAGNSYLVDMSNLYLDLQKDGDLFFRVPIEYIKLIIKQNNPLPMLKHYLLLCSTINVKGKHYGCHNIEWFVENLAMTEKTIRNQREIFEELGIVVFSGARSGITPNGDFINLPKLYTMPNNKDVVNEFREKQLNKSITDYQKALKKKLIEEKQRLKKEQAKQRQKQTDFSNPFSNLEETPF